MNLFEFLLDPASWTGPSGIPARLLQHLLYSGAAVLLAALVAIPLGVVIGHTRRGDAVASGLSNAARAIPTLGLLVLVVTLLGTGAAPVVGALAVLAVPPVLINTVAGFRQADQEAVHAGRALGMTPWQLVRQVELPLATPLIVSGVRSASLQVIATATVAALAAAGGLGRFVVDGQRLGPEGYPQMLAGAVLVALLAIVVDLLLGGLSWQLERRRRHIRREERGDLDALRAGELAEQAAARPDTADRAGDADRPADAATVEVPAGETPDTGPRPGHR
ncbi:ABC transporter permease [Desertihabitans brevis]|uniref:ABC transporter permease n=1 Tax=Desertihabitans brevis TaxID=2268447 RepID=UPI001314BB12|nr:ABC transporter permease subunit [Desertihabitans brevis]